MLASIFLIAACGLVYELLIATVSSYLLGSSVTQFSISIGVFIGAMGIGSHLSQRIRRNLLGRFIFIEIAIGILGGFSVPLLFWSYAGGVVYWLILYGLLISIGALTGLELPLLTRILRQYGSLRTIIAQALSFDYVGALAGSLLFPLLLLPVLGLARTGFLIGALNVGVGLWNVRVFRETLRSPSLLTGIAGSSAGLLAAGFLFSTQLVSLAESHLYEDPIVFTAQTPYQRIVITRWKNDMRLFLDGNLQFASPDEYRYHEALVHPAMSLPPVVESVLILGGGDGLGMREVKKYPNVRRIVLVDIDPRMTELARTFPSIVQLNENALRDPRLEIVHQDAYKYLENTTERFDVIIGDLPDPNSDVLAKLYSVEFYKLVTRHLTAAGVFVTQSSSPFFSRDAFWGIAATLEAAGLRIAPYHAYVPSFGDWGFILAAPRKIDPARVSLKTTQVRYLTKELLPGMFLFEKDTGRVPVEPSTLDRPTILQYYVNDSRQWK